tara:strand:+ start:260 stop:430 length:171 start_codon:yes stop_codon:yes gene_type:complete
MASPDKERVTLCGHKTTVQEFKRIRNAKPHEINCKRCLKLYERKIEVTEIKMKVPA